MPLQHTSIGDFVKIVPIQYTLIGDFVKNEPIQHVSIENFVKIVPIQHASIGDFVMMRDCTPIHAPPNTLAPPLLAPNLAQLDLVP